MEHSAPARNDDSTALVLVHGLWMTGIELFYLRRRMRSCGFRVYTYYYSTVLRSLPETAVGLNGFLQRIPEPVVHLMGHSMGGLVIRRLLLDFPAQRPGRVVTLGTPHHGSRVAKCIGRYAPGRWMLGKSMQALTQELPSWSGERELGVIVGDRPYGLGRLTGCLPEPNDGTVAVDEALLSGATDTLILPVSHASILFSPRASDEACHFLRHGCFLEGRITNVT